jgi:hypothetical protein
LSAALGLAVYSPECSEQLCFGLLLLKALVVLELQPQLAYPEVAELHLAGDYEQPLSDRLCQLPSPAGQANRLLVKREFHLASSLRREELLLALAARAELQK